MTEFPIKATVTIRGLLRPSLLMSYVRINVVFPGGHKHIYSGLYMVTERRDDISEAGYTTTLGLFRVGGDPDNSPFLDEVPEEWYKVPLR